MSVSWGIVHHQTFCFQFYSIMGRAFTLNLGDFTSFNIRLVQGDNPELHYITIINLGTGKTAHEQKLVN